MKKISGNSLYTAKDALIFLAPATAGTFLFVIVPIFCSFALSFFDWDLLAPPVFVGIDNYIEIFTHSEYIKILCNTVVYALFTAGFGILLPLILAYLVVRKFPFCEEFKLICFLPYITPMVVIGTVWCWIFDPTSGLINNLLCTDCRWLYDKNLAMGIIIFVSVWKLLGYNMLLYIAGFANINMSLIEAAKTDGASDFSILSRIVIPLMVPAIIFVAAATLISSFQVFDLIYIMTQGGPDGATDVVVYSVYREGFEYFSAGKSCALGYILFFVILLLTGIPKVLIKK